jgi:type IV pilus assembly protein PilO
MAKFTDLSPKVQLGVVLGVLVLLTAGLYYYQYKAMDDQNRQTRTQLEAKRKENDALRPFADKKADMERKIASLKEQLENLKRIVPEEKEVPQLMQQVQAQAVRSGIEVRRYTAQNTVTKEFFTEVPFIVELDGPYYSLLKFFENVARMDRIVNVSGLRMASVHQPGAAGVKKTYTYAPGESVVVSCVVTTFFSRTAPAPAAAATKK